MNKLQQMIRILNETKGITDELISKRTGVPLTFIRWTKNNFPPSPLYPIAGYDETVITLNVKAIARFYNVRMAG